MTICTATCPLWACSRRTPWNSRNRAAARATADHIKKGLVILPKVSWDQAKAASERLLQAAEPFSESVFSRFGRSPGVYVFVYSGSQLGGSLWGEPKPAIVYLGHNGEDSRRHWLDDTGVSTVRRSLAALLAGDLPLTAVPNEEAQGEDRFLNYALDEESESRLTAWMKENLRLAFLDTEAEAVEDWYRALLEYNTPLLVLRNNPMNSAGPQIKLYRSRLAEQAAGRSAE